MTTNQPARVLVEPGLYRRGAVYEIRVGYRDGAGRRHDTWQTVGTSKRAAKAALIEARAKAQRQPIAPGAGKLTMSTFMCNHFLPYLDHERVAKSRDLHPNTALKYRSYAANKVIPAIGHLRVAEVNTGHIELLLNDLRAGGRDPRAGSGLPRCHPDFVYEQIRAKRAEGWSHSDVAVWLAGRHPLECGHLTKDAVAAIFRRDLRRCSASSAAQNGLEVSTVRKIHTMLRSAWRFGVAHDLIPRDRAHVVADARVPARAKDEPKAEIVCWTADDYCRFFDWAVHHRLSISRAVPSAMVTLSLSSAAISRARS